jgi:hypothetical protein
LLWLHHLVVSNIVPSSPQDAASDCKTATGHWPEGQAMELMDNARHQDLSRRAAPMISRIVTGSLFDVPVDDFRPAVSAGGS